MKAKCPQFWTEDPSVLLKEAYDFFPFHEKAQQCTTTALNSFTRFGIYLGILLALMTTKMTYILLGVGIAILAAAGYYGMKNKDILREGFAPGSAMQPAGVAPTYKEVPESNVVTGSDAAGRVVEDVIGKTTRTGPTAANPFMNVLLAEIGDNPQRPPAQDGSFLKRQFSEQFTDKVYGDPSDVFQKSQNQRVWNVQPITSVPNDQESFQNWLFRTPGRTCKEGNTRACKTGTEGGQITWLSQA